jgi:NADPH:quinone reductase-like Zn-dependent oxidoreductase
MRYWGSRCLDRSDDGSLSSAVQHVYPLDQFKEAFKQSLKSNRSGKILFQFGATDVAGISK